MTAGIMESALKRQGLLTKGAFCVSHGPPKWVPGCFLCCFRLTKASERVAYFCHCPTMSLWLRDAGHGFVSVRGFVQSLSWAGDRWNFAQRLSTQCLGIC